MDYSGENREKCEKLQNQLSQCTHTSCGCSSTGSMPDITTISESINIRRSLSMVELQEESLSREVYHRSTYFDEV